MKKISLLIGVFLMFVFGCIEDENVPDLIVNVGLPVFNDAASEVMEWTASTVTVKAELLKENGSQVVEYGFCYDTLPTPTIERNMKKIDLGAGIGQFRYVIEGLKGNSQYFIRPYAINSEGVQYGTRDLTVKTNTGLGIVTTMESKDVRAGSAIVGGRILNRGEGEIIKRGVYYSTDSMFATKKVAYSLDTTDVYTCLLTNLEPLSKYYVKAFVENLFGIFEANNIDASVETTDGLPFVGGLAVVRGFTDATATSKVIDEGDSVVTERGFCWGTIMIPTIDNQVIVCGSGVGEFSALIENLVAGQQYYVRAYARNHYGIKYGDDVISFVTKRDIPTVETSDVEGEVLNGELLLKGIILDEGMTTVQSAGICYSTMSRTPTLADGVAAMSIASDNTFSGKISSMIGGQTYYIRAFAINSRGVAYGSVKTYRTPNIFNTDLAEFPGAAPLSKTSAYFAVRDVLYLAGGDVGPNLTNKLWSYSITENIWREMAPMSKAVKWHSAVSYGNGAMVFGGLTEGRERENTLNYYNVSPQNSWDVLDACPDSISQSIGFSNRENVYFIGGKGDSVLNRVWSFRMGLGWTQRADFPVAQYEGVAITMDNGDVYVGMGKDDYNVCNGKLYRANGDFDVWSDPIVCPLYSGGILAGESCRGKIYLIDESYRIIEYNPKTDVWRMKSYLPAGYREIHCMYRYANKIYIGIGTAKSIISYDPSLDN